MINQLTINNMEFILEAQNTFYEIYKQKNELINTMTSNPYVKVCTYSVDKKLAAIIQYQDIYDRFELDNIYVLKEYRNKGVASILLNYMIEEGKNKKITNITLEVREDNIKAINLYKKYGFIKKAIRSNYYKDCNGILMEKEMM
ncbi:MAG: GNAT family N-acetyltransferase [Bacilli bacterium]|nr:GNAT family N-acetyltransferase [Bacilli bacterium]